MTCNQRRAATLAQSVCDGTVPAADVTDADWGLLLRAADLHNTHSLPLSVCHRVLDRARRREQRQDAQDDQNRTFHEGHRGMIPSAGLARPRC